jgi:hypothetical protein
VGNYGDYYKGAGQNGFTVWMKVFSYFSNVEITNESLNFPDQRAVLRR